uniref:Uncharacterized protein n=1 Tax=Brassica oleracea TaxID=3712 RepID=A0A3P6D8G2_BRAOL|nr:unnamed protein product [Brassica oleracea]
MFALTIEDCMEAELQTHNWVGWNLPQTFIAGNALDSYRKRPKQPGFPNSMGCGIW